MGGTTRRSELALEEARASIAEQIEALEKLRNRAVGYAGSIVVAAGFLVGRGPGLVKDPLRTMATVMGLGGTLAAACLAAAVLAPRKFNFTVRAHEIMEDEGELLACEPSLDP